MPQAALKIAAESPARVSCVSAGRTALYRHFDASGSLLYVGVSLSPTYRLSQHRAGSAWFDRIADIRVEWFDTREAALEAERAAIQAEKPECNITHAKPTSAHAAYLAELAEESCDELTYKVTRLQPSYDLLNAGMALSLGPQALRWAMAAGEIAYYCTGPKSVAITGWSVISYLEAMQAGALKARSAPKRPDGRSYAAPSSEWLCQHHGSVSIKEWMAHQDRRQAELQAMAAEATESPPPA